MCTTSGNKRNWTFIRNSSTTTWGIKGLCSQTQVLLMKFLCWHFNCNNSASLIRQEGSAIQVLFCLPFQMFHGCHLRVGISLTTSLKGCSWLSRLGDLLLGEPSLSLVICCHLVWHLLVVPCGSSCRTSSGCRSVCDVYIHWRQYLGHSQYSDVSACLNHQCACAVKARQRKQLHQVTRRTRRTRNGRWDERGETAATRGGRYWDHMSIQSDSCKMWSGPGTACLGLGLPLGKPSLLVTASTLSSSLEEAVRHHLFPLRIYNTVLTC